MTFYNTSKNFGISRLDLVKGHAYHYDIDEEIENGLLVEIDYTTGKVAPTTDPSKTQHYLSSVTNLYDSADESNFINRPSGMKVRVITLEVGDIITTTQFTGKEIGNIVEGDYGYATEGGKFTVADEASEDATQVFRVKEATVLNGYPAVAFQVESVSNTP